MLLVSGVPGLLVVSHEAVVGRALLGIIDAWSPEAIENMLE